MFFFFSSRRRHTRCGRDWSSDVCSSDLALDVHEDVVRQFQDSLAADEQLRADRFEFAQDRRRFVVRRGALRVVLGWYLTTSPDRLRFEWNRYGKPSLAAQAG